MNELTYEVDLKSNIQVSVLAAGMRQAMCLGFLAPALHRHARWQKKQGFVALWE
jgi:hypothetical protein